MNEDQETEFGRVKIYRNYIRFLRKQMKKEFPFIVIGWILIVCLLLFGLVEMLIYEQHIWAVFYFALGLLNVRTTYIHMDSRKKYQTIIDQLNVILKKIEKSNDR